MKKHSEKNMEMPAANKELFHDACVIIEQAQAVAYRAVNEILIKRNWLLGMRIQHEVLNDKRAEYGEQVIAILAKQLTERYGRGYKKSNLYLFISFYQEHPNIFQSVTGKLLADATEKIFQSVSGKSENNLLAVATQSEIVSSMMGISNGSDLYSNMTSEYPLRLSWTHYCIILQEQNPEARAWYENEAANEMWSTRTLQRNVSSQYYHRMLQSQNKATVHDLKDLTPPLGCCFVPTPMMMWRIIPFSMAATNFTPPSTSPICLRKRNFGARLNSRRSSLGYKMGNEQ